MVKDGSMEIEMSQGVAGIKGTIFVCEEDGQTSTLKVIEGSVVFTDRATGEQTTVAGGEMISAGAGETPVISFDAKREHDLEVMHRELEISNKAGSPRYSRHCRGGASVAGVDRCTCDQQKETLCRYAWLLSDGTAVQPTNPRCDVLCKLRQANNYRNCILSALRKKNHINEIIKKERYLCSARTAVR
jgi:hypothetical protein